MGTCAPDINTVCWYVFYRPPKAVRQTIDFPLNCQSSREVTDTFSDTLFWLHGKNISQARFFSHAFHDGEQGLGILSYTVVPVASGSLCLGGVGS